MTQTEIDDLARALGMGPDVCPWLWRCDRCGWMFKDFHRCRCNGVYMNGYKRSCVLPDPEGDDTAVMLWDGALLRALVNVCKAHLALCMQPSHYGDWYVQGVTGSGENDLRATHGAVSTAALLAAWRATR